MGWKFGLHKRHKSYRWGVMGHVRGVRAMSGGYRVCRGG